MSLKRATVQATMGFIWRERTHEACGVRGFHSNFAGFVVVLGDLRNGFPRVSGCRAAAFL